MAFSPTTVVLADEIIRLSRQFLEGFSLNHDSVALSEVQETGPGGNFFLAGLTQKLFRNMSHGSRVWPGLTLDQWNSQQHPKADELLRSYTCELLSKLEPPGDHDELMALGKKQIEDLTDF